MKKFLKENKNLVIGIFLLVIIFPFIILVPSPIGFIPYEVGLTLIGYGGSIIGGFLTLYGVWWTINDQENKRKNDLAIQYMPLITCDQYEVETNDIVDNIMDCISTSVFSTFKGEILNSNIKEVKIILKFTNHGRGEAIVTNLKSLLAIYPAEDDNFIDEYHDNPLEYNNIIIAVSQSKNVNLILSFDKTKPIPKKMIFSIYLTYFSHFDNSEINLHTSLRIKIDKNTFINDNKIQVDIFSSNNEYEKNI